MAKSSKGVDIQFASIVELARCVECLEKIAENLEKRTPHALQSACGVVCEMNISTTAII